MEVNQGFLAGQSMVLDQIRHSIKGELMEAGEEAHNLSRTQHSMSCNLLWVECEERIKDMIPDYNTL